MSESSLFFYHTASKAVDILVKTALFTIFSFPVFSKATIVGLSVELSIYYPEIRERAI